MAFRDAFDRCPRCGVNLEDASSARGCRSCGGMFVEQPVLAEMLLRMLPPPPRPYGSLALSESRRGGQPLPCPACGDGMKATEICEVELDHCPKHGVWFDPDELRVALYRVADPRNPPPFGEWTSAARPPARPVPPAPGRKPERVIVAPVAKKRRTVFEVREPDLPPRQVALDVGVIKIGKKLQGMHIVLGNDPHASRMHAVIEVEDDAVTVIDLGSPSGTYVNEEKINKKTIEPGDFIRCAGSQILFVSVEP